jgi:hypothetical protein
MLEQLHLEYVSLDRSGEVLCALCGQGFMSSSSTGILYAEDVPVGHLCSECLAGPHMASIRVLERARKIRHYAQESRYSVPRPKWLTMLQAAASRASYWEHLANRIQNLDSWVSE